MASPPKTAREIYDAVMRAPTDTQSVEVIAAAQAEATRPLVEALREARKFTYGSLCYGSEDADMRAGMQSLLVLLDAALAGGKP